VGKHTRNRHTANKVCEERCLKREGEDISRKSGSNRESMQSGKRGLLGGTFKTMGGFCAFSTKQKWQEHKNMRSNTKRARIGSIPFKSAYKGRGKGKGKETVQVGSEVILKNIGFVQPSRWGKAFWADRRPIKGITGIAGQNGIGGIHLGLRGSSSTRKERRISL